MRISEYQKVTGPFVDAKYGTHFDRVNREIQSKGGKPVEPFINGYGSILPRGMYNQLNFFAPPPTWTEPSNYYYFFKAFKAIFQKAIDDKLDNLLFVEDDLGFLDGFDEVLESGLKDLPDDWEMLYMGANHIWHRTEQVGENLLRLNGSYCLHCVGVRKSVFQEIVDFPEVSGGDVSVARHIHPRGNCYALWPNKAVQIPNRSTLVNQDVDYSEYFKSKGNNW